MGLGVTSVFTGNISLLLSSYPDSVESLLAWICFLDRAMFFFVIFGVLSAESLLLDLVTIVDLVLSDSEASLRSTFVEVGKDGSRLYAGGALCAFGALCTGGRLGAGGALNVDGAL